MARGDNKEVRGFRLRPSTRPSCGLSEYITPSFLRELPDCPSLRASSDHRFIVGALRARRMVWRLPSHLIVRVLRARRAPGHSLLPPRKREQILAEVPSFAVVSCRNPGHGNSFPRSLSQPHKSLLHINQFHSPLLSGYAAGPGIALLHGITHAERSRPCHP